MLEITVVDPPRHQFLTCEALLFDMDGTLVDSRVCVEQTLRAWGVRHGLDIDELLQIAHGRQNDDIVRLVAPHLEPATELAYLTKAEEDCVDGLAAVRGARRLLHRLDPARWAVVTSAWRRLAEIRLGRADLPVPPVLITADELRQGKPHPDGYLRAAARLGVEPTACVVVEDAPVGIAAARAAGMRVIGITTTFGRAQLDSDWHVDDLASVIISTPGSDTPAYPAR